MLIHLDEPVKADTFARPNRHFISQTKLELISESVFASLFPVLVCVTPFTIAKVLFTKRNKSTDAVKTHWRASNSDAGGERRLPRRSDASGRERRNYTDADGGRLNECGAFRELCKSCRADKERGGVDTQSRTDLIMREEAGHEGSCILIKFEDTKSPWQLRW